MNKNKLKNTILTITLAGVATIGFSACDKGTEPGETNVERSEIKDAGELVGDDDETKRTSDTTNLEKYYDDADHENHEDNTDEAIGDGAYDGKGDGVNRDEVQ
ncbi:hypothetical protein ACSX1A_19375 [Pontibacter sp. MBLB2868]|uniref:hypothetical protein n=1 Tax=Pontibacter sp. MBLB2868 TaxID=3451555 RepID=UPI003F756996